MITNLNNLNQPNVKSLNYMNVIETDKKGGKDDEISVTKRT